MLKSLSTQFAATLFFGPLGLAYSSMAAAVFFTLVLAVLYFTGLGILAVGLVWPIAIIVGLVFVKLHNDQITSAGSSLLLGPDDEPIGVSTMGSWGRGVAVLSLLGVIGYLAFWYFPANKKADEYASERSEIRSSDSGTLLGSSSSDGSTSSSSGFSSGSRSGSGDISDLAIAKTYPIESDTGSSASSASGSGDFSVVTLDQQEVQSIVIGTSSQPDTSGNRLYVQSELVNLREGPGTNFSILSTVERGEELAEIDRAGSWIRIRTTGTGATGWIFNRLVSTQP